MLCVVLIIICKIYDKIPGKPPVKKAGANDANETQNKPFILSISLGVTYYSEENHDINVLLKLADERQYEEKRIHHKERK